MIYFNLNCTKNILLELKKNIKNFLEKDSLRRDILRVWHFEKFSLKNCNPQRSNSNIVIDKIGNERRFWVMIPKVIKAFEINENKIYNLLWHHIWFIGKS